MRSGVLLLFTVTIFYDPVLLKNKIVQRGVQYFPRFSSIG